ncbi:unnamed protein product [Thelazia callipaeda]|uniref:Seipin n=1 Tax=Thelazia callipaeda TaxID=103827 RepID=A0A0N5CKP1_THECL|nr:unnamed protein product [Thelazia callipaeda]
MPGVKEIGSWIRDRFTFYDFIIFILQIFSATLIGIIWPFILRSLLLPSVVEYSAPLYFNFETCREQLAGVCSFPTANIDFSIVCFRFISEWSYVLDIESPSWSLKDYYEVSVEAILSQSTITSNIGIFQISVVLVDEVNVTKIFRRSCYASKNRSLLSRIGHFWWDLSCKTIFFPAYFIGFLTVTDDRKIKVSFPNYLRGMDLAKMKELYVQLQNRFIEVESGTLLFRARFGLLRVFLYDYPIFSYCLFACLTYFGCLMGIAFYWMLKAFFGSIRL